MQVFQNTILLKILLEIMIQMMVFYRDLLLAIQLTKINRVQYSLEEK